MAALPRFPRTVVTICLLVAVPHSSHCVLCPWRYLWGHFGIDTDEWGPEAIYGIAYILPSIALGVRRLHDVGRSGKWLWIGLTGIGCLPLLYWFLQPSFAETSDWGDAAATAGRDEQKPPQKPGDIIR